MLDLMKDEGFRAQYPRLTILNPVALLQALTPPPTSSPELTDARGQSTIVAARPSAGQGAHLVGTAVGFDCGGHGVDNIKVKAGGRSPKPGESPDRLSCTGQ